MASYLPGSFTLYLESTGNFNLARDELTTVLNDFEPDTTFEVGDVATGQRILGSVNIGGTDYLLTINSLNFVFVWGIKLTAFSHPTIASLGAVNTAPFSPPGSPLFVTGTSSDNAIVGDIGNDTLSGRGGMDTLTGGDGDDLIRGGGGNDEINGGADADRLIGHAGNDTLNGGNGDDLLRGGSGADQLNGEGGRDTLRGGSGNDTLMGGANKDILRGGADADTFLYTATTDSGLGGNADRIRDFTRGEDHIDLSAFTGLSFVGTSGFSGTGNEVRFTTTGNGSGIARVEVDVDGDGNADMRINVAGAGGVLDGGDFIL